MYYYIFESPQGQKGFERTAQIKEQLSVLGIAGEMAMLSTGKTVVELIDIAVAKRYSTIVAVGGVELINQVARAIEPYDVVFGIIPNSDNPDIAGLIGTNDWKEAVNFLKKRLWKAVRLGIINETNCFLTPASIEIKDDNKYQFKTKKYSAEGSGGLVVRVSPIGSEDEKVSQLRVEFLHNESGKNRSIFSKIFKKEEQIVQNSCFVVNSFDLNTTKPAQIIVAGTEVGATPISCQTQEKMIRLIVGKTI